MIHAWYSREAAELYSWAQQEINRIKASRIYKVAISLEERYRKHHKSIVDDPYTKPVCAPPPGRPPNGGSSVQYIRLHGANHPLCIGCNRPVEDKIDIGDRPTARIVCKDCTGTGY